MILFNMKLVLVECILEYFNQEYNQIMIILKYKQLEMTIQAQHNLNLFKLILVNQPLI
jgi:hypothetical protein